MKEFICILDPFGPGLKLIDLPDEEEVVPRLNTELGIVDELCSKEQCLPSEDLSYFTMKEKFICILDPLGPGLKAIDLPDEKEVVVGLNTELGIVDELCSQEQLVLTADCIGRTVTVEVNGFSPSWVDGKILKKGEKVCAKHGSIIEVVTGLHRYEVLFRTIIKKEPLKDGEVDQEKKRTFEWEILFNEGVMLCTTSDFDGMKNKIAAFDLDNTLVPIESGQVFPENFEDLKLLGDFVKPCLTNLNNKGWKIIIFANCDHLVSPKGKLPLTKFKKNIENILIKLDVPTSIYISMTEGYYRKPAPGMWELMKTKAPSLEINLGDSFYCGDAAGRPDNWKLGCKADSSASDHLFALNIDINFLTPEEFFLEEAAAPSYDFGFDPLSSDNTEIFQFLRPDNQEVIIMTGSPASGKSYFVNTQLILKGYERISCDDLGSWKKCVAALKKFLDLGRNVVVDDANPDIASRQRYVEVCKELIDTVRCFCLNTPLDRCLHNNMYRRIMDSTHEFIASDAIKSFHSSFQQPTVEEGFSEIVFVPFTPTFSDEKLKKAYDYRLVSSCAN